LAPDIGVTDADPFGLCSRFAPRAEEKARTENSLRPFVPVSMFASRARACQPGVASANTLTAFV
jgi:hypothetical protein